MNMPVINMHAPVQRTAAESALVDAFGVRFSTLPGNEAVAMKRDDAIEQVKSGLPTRRVESWHYTDLRRLLTAVPAFEATAPVKPVAPVVASSSILPVLNGVATGRAPAIDGVEVTRLADKLLYGSFASALDPRGDDDAIGALNAAFVADGWVVDIASGSQRASPIQP